MGKRILFILLALQFVVSACGSHEQTLSRQQSKRPVVESGETDKTLILINAVNSGDMATLRKQGAEGADLNVRNNEGLTLVMIAIRASQFAAIEYLVEQEVNLDLTTENEEIKPAMDARDYLESLGVDESLKKIFRAILNKETIDTSTLGEHLYSAITFKNVGLLKWIFSKGFDPNFIRMTSSGKPKDSGLIYIFSLKGVEGEELKKLTAIFDVFVEHQDIDVNLKVKRSTPLSKAERRLKSNSAYKPMVDKLISMGAR